MTWGQLFYSNKNVYFLPVKILDNRFTFEGSILSGFPTFCLMSPMLAPAGISCGLNKRRIIFMCFHHTICDITPFSHNEAHMLCVH